MLYLHENIIKYFEEKLKDLNCRQDTKSYIISIYGRYKSSDADLSKDSLTLMFAQARHKQDFMLFQNLGNWIFFSNTVAPNYLKNASKDYYDNMARLSYYSCYKLINKQWKLFEELSDNFLTLEEQVKNKLSLILK